GLAPAGTDSVGFYNKCYASANLTSLSCLGKKTSFRSRRRPTGDAAYYCCLRIVDEGSNVRLLLHPHPNKKEEKWESAVASPGCAGPTPRQRAAVPGPPDPVPSALLLVA